MFGNFLFNKLVFGRGKNILEGDFSGSFSYNGYSFDSDNIIIGNIPGIDDMGNISRNTYKTAREDGMGFVSQTIDNNVFSVEGTIRASSASELDLIKRSIKQKLFVPNSTLYYRRPTGEVWQATASCVGLKFHTQQHTIDVVRFTFTFEVIDPFFYDQNRKFESYLSQSSSFNTNIENLFGDRPAEPEVVVQFGTGISSVTSVTLTLGDDIISASGTFNDSDIVTFDCKEKDVLLNSIGEQKYTGSFGALKIGSTALDISIDGIWTADIYVYWYPTHG